MALNAVFFEPESDVVYRFNCTAFTSGTDQRPLVEVARAGRASPKHHPTRRAAKGRPVDWESHWQEIHDVVIPLVAHFTRTNTKGEKAHGKILDSSGEQAGEMLAGALLGLLVSPDRQWMGLKATNEDLNGNDRVALWLDDASKRMLKVFNSPRSNFYLSQHEKYLELVNLGTGGQFIADRPGIGPKFMGRTLSELYLAENADGDVDQVFRWYKIAARQAVQHFGERAGTKAVKAAMNPKKEHDEFEFIHAVSPRQGPRHHAAGPPQHGVRVDHR